MVTFNAGPAIIPNHNSKVEFPYAKCTHGYTVHLEYINKQINWISETPPKKTFIFLFNVYANNFFVIITCSLKLTQNHDC